MNLNIKASHTSLTPAIRQAIEEKLSVLETFLKPEDKLHVEVDATHEAKGQLRVDVSIQPHGHYAEAHGKDFYEALDLVVPKIKEQLRKGKDKKVSLRRRLGSLFKR